MESGYEIIKRLRKGEIIKCADCKKEYYTTNAEDISIAREFRCNKCNSVLRISPNIMVE